MYSFNNIDEFNRYYEVIYHVIDVYFDYFNSTNILITFRQYYQISHNIMCFQSVKKITESHVIIINIFHLSWSLFCSYVVM